MRPFRLSGKNDANDAQAICAAVRSRPDRRNRLAAWIVAAHDRIGYHKILIVIANKHARLLWVLLTRDEPLRMHEATA